MRKVLTEKDIFDGTQISSLFSMLTEENKNIAMGYLFALNDKEVMDRARKLQET